MHFYQENEPENPNPGDYWFDKKTSGYAIWHNNSWCNIKGQVKPYPKIIFDPTEANYPNINNILVNNANNPPPLNRTPNLVVNNLVNSDENFTTVLKEHWNGNQFTKLDLFTADNINQKGLCKINGFPSYGSTMFQSSDNNVGMFLNVFHKTLPLPQYSGCSLQYQVGFNSVGIPVFQNDEMLCVKTEAIVTCSYNTGAVNQGLITLHFTNDLNQYVFFNVCLYDSRPDWQANDTVIWDSFDTNTAIIVSYAQTQGVNNPNIKYSSPLYGYNDSVLLPFAKGASPDVKGTYGFSISKDQFELALRDVNRVFNSGLDTTASNWRLGFALIGPEINMLDNKYGHLAMSTNGLQIYRDKI